MIKRITKVMPKKPIVPARKRVCAYTRVSSGKAAMLHSLSAQVSYYSSYIRKNPEWEYAGVYTDEALTGTKGNRQEFQWMLRDCRDGKIDMIITKSISRFARNTVTLLETVRELKALGVDVYFEEQNIHSMSGDGELMLTILASYAQEESRSVSENCKWRVHQQHKAGKTYGWGFMYGYRIKNGIVTIHEKEAEIVRWVFESYLEGMGAAEIARILREKKVSSYRGGVWDHKRVLVMLKNEKYCGDSLLQKKFVEDHLSKKLKINYGELPRYYVEDCHPAIISRDDYQMVQCMIEINFKRYNISSKAPVFSALTGMIVCGNCGKKYRRKISAYENAWNCATYLTLGRDACPAKKIPEDVIRNTAASVLDLPEFDEDAFRNQIKEIRVPGPNQLAFVFHDGNVVERNWVDKSRRDSWTAEMRTKAAEATARRYAV